MDKQETGQFQDALFRVKKKNGTWRLVDAPNLHGVQIADAHTHVHYAQNPALAIARAGFNNVSYICNVFDAYEDDFSLVEKLYTWKQEAEMFLASFNAGECHGGELCAQGSQTAKEVPAAQDAPTVESDTVAQIGQSEPCALHIPQIQFACGCHPHNAKYYTPELEQKLRLILKDARAVALGEIGLDYHYDFSPVKEQKEVFAQQLELAQELDMPVVLHVREAHDDALEIVQHSGAPAKKILLHCFTDNWETLEPWIDAGCSVSFGGAISFGNADDIRDAASRVPVQQLMLETDAPYMAPKPFRGMKCEPAQIIFTAEKMLQVRGIEKEEEQREFLESCYQNVMNFFGAWQA
jgi:TatD DNase family protein